MRYHETSLQVRFYEVDAYGVVWHGHYVGWFEAGRNDLTQRYQMGPLQLKDKNLLAPVVDLSCQFKLPATFRQIPHHPDHHGENRGGQIDLSLSGP